MTQTAQADLFGKAKPELRGGYTYDTPELRVLYHRTVEIAEKIPEFEHILPSDFILIRCLKKKERANPEDPAKRLHTIAECIYVREPIRAAAELLGVKLPPYLLICYPPFFDDPKENTPEQQVVTLVHELGHIKESKKGSIPHWGFGDERSKKLAKQFLADRKLDETPEEKKAEAF
jgi:hypothetical protein